MRLQIKKLDGPDEIRLNNSADTIYLPMVTNNTAENRFTCYFNRPVNDDETIITVHIKIYNAQGNLQTEWALIVTQANIYNRNRADANFNFIVILNCPEILTGSYFYVHAVLPNADTNAQDVSYGVSSYHQTIKKAYIYAQKQFNQVYWSTSEQINYEEERATRESPRTGNIGQNEDAFLHIKTRGMYEDQVVLLLSADDGEVELRRQTITMNQNRKVVAFDMAEVIQRYRQQKPATGNVSFTLKATLTIPDPHAGNTNTTASGGGQNSNTTTQERSWIEVPLITLALIVTAPLWILSGCTSDRSGRNASPSSGQVNPGNIIQGSTGELTVNCTDRTPATKRTSTGTVYVNVNTGETSEITPTKFTDFRIGYIFYIEGVGKTVNRENNTLVTNLARTVYPCHIYEYLLSDLVVIGAITIDDAILMAPPPATNTDQARRQKREQLENDFNKFTQRIADRSLLIDKFRDPQNRNATLRVRINGTFVRKLLAQARVMNPIFSDFICRDAWQGDNGRANGRYHSCQECPPGEYFLNYIPRSSWANNRDGTPKYDRHRLRVSSPMYRIGVSQILVDSNIYTYFNQGATRTGIAVHNGGSTASTGCITFNTPHNYDGNEDFINTIYQVDIGADGARDDSARTNRDIDRKKINLICVDERNALQENRDRRHYDLIDRNRNITQ